MKGRALVWLLAMIMLERYKRAIIMLVLLLYVICTNVGKDMLREIAIEVGKKSEGFWLEKDRIVLCPS